MSAAVAAQLATEQVYTPRTSIHASEPPETAMTLGPPTLASTSGGPPLAARRITVPPVRLPQ